LKFRVTSIAEEAAGRAILGVLPTLEDWLNTALGDGDFGGTVDYIVLVVYATTFVPSSGKPVPLSRLSTHDDLLTGKRVQSLSLFLQIDPDRIASTPPTSMHRLISTELIARLPARPLRVPKGLDYSRVRAAITASLAAFTSSEA
jgi:hypothetical protein